MLKWKENFVKTLSAETFLSRSFPNSTIFGHGSHKGNKWGWSIRFEHMSISNAGYISNSTLAVLIVLTEQPSNATGYTRSINLALPTPFMSARAHTHCCVWKFVRAFVKFVLQSQIAIHNVKMSLGWIHIVNIAISKGILGTFVTLEWKYFTNLFKCGTI